MACCCDARTLSGDCHVLWEPSHAEKCTSEACSQLLMKGVKPLSGRCIVFKRI